MSEISELRFRAHEKAGDVSALLQEAPNARWMLLLAHGAGAGMRHPFMNAIAAKLAAREIATFRYQFPYMERGSRSPDPQPVLLSTVRAAAATARKSAGKRALIAGGKSMGGRMTSLAFAEEPLEGVRGIAFFGFPLHPPGARGTARSEHLATVTVPMLFLQGTRDTFADLELLRPVLDGLGTRATLHIVEEGDHSFAVPKRTGRSADQVLDDLADTVRAWAETL